MSISRRRTSPAELNRATLARQLLLDRSPVRPLDAIERLVGLQAQVPRPPYIGLWSRLAEFDAQHLHDLVHGKHAVRATMMRGTIHLMSARDFLALRAALEPLLSAGIRIHAKGTNLRAITAHAKKLMPARFEAVRAGLAKKFPKLATPAFGYAVRSHLPLVLVPTADARWAYPGNADFHDAETWLGSPIAAGAVELLLRRYLAAFGPASVKDAQAWSGLRSLGPVFEAMRDSLVVLHDGERELFDLPDAPRPAGDVPAPVRFLPEFDNLLLAYADHARMVDPARRPSLTSKNGIVAATFLVDGRVAGTWTLARTKTTATLTLVPFSTLTKATTAALEAEGEALLRWHEPDATAFRVRVTRAR